MKSFIFFSTFALLICTPTVGQDFFSFSDIQSVNNKITIVGKYSELLKKQGLPDDTIKSNIGITDYIYWGNTDSIIERRFRRIEVTYLTYGDSLRYIKIGDSVQITFADLSVSNITFILWGHMISKNFRFYEAKRIFSLDEDDEKFTIVEYYNEKPIKIKTYGIHTKKGKPYDDNLWFAFFKRNNKLWYIDFPLKCNGSIIK